MKRPLNAARTALIAQSLLWAVVLSVPGCNNPGSGSGAGGSVSVTPKTTQSIQLSLDPTNSIPKGLQLPFSATVSYTDGTTSAQSSGLTWTSSNPGVLAVDSSGTATGMAIGSAIVTATDPVSQASGSLTVTVTNAVLKKVRVAPSSTSVPACLNAQFSASGVYTDGSAYPLTSGVTWTSGNTSIATVDSTGLVSGVAEGGPVTIGASYPGPSGSLSGTAQAAVSALSSIAVSAPNGSTVAAGFSLQLAAQGTADDGTTANLTVPAAAGAWGGVTWSSSNASVATVDANGLVTGMTVGTVTISVTGGCPAATGSIQVTVSPAIPKSVIVTNSTSTTTSSSGSTSGSTTSNPPAPVTPVIQATVSVASGLSASLFAYATMSDGTTVSITNGATWTTSDPSVATVSASGVVTGVAPGTATITATYCGQNMTASCPTATAQVTVTPAVLVSLAVSPIAPLPTGLTLQLTVAGVYSDGTSPTLLNASVSWASSNTAVAVVDGSGTVTALSSGTTTITATFGNQSATIAVTIAPAALETVSISPSSVTVAAGMTVQVTASGSYSDGTTHALASGIAWSTSNPAVATVDSTGLVTGLASGTVTITATVGSASATTQAVVTPAVLQTISVSPPSATVAAGLAVQMTASGTYSNGTTATLASGVTWTSSNTGVATVLGTGVVSGVAQGAATITASYGGLSGTSAVNVTAPVLQSVGVSPPSASTPAGLTVQLTANGNYSDGSSAALSSGVTWTSSNTMVAIVNSSGVVTGVVPGTATITASSAGFSGASTVTVTAAVLQAVSVTPSSASVAPGLTVQLTANGSYSDGTTKALTSGVTWASSSNGIATVSSSGLVMGVAPGAATVTAGYGGFSGASAVTVTAPALQSVSVSPTAATVPEGMTEQLTAYGNYSDGSSAALSSGVTWTSGNTGVATVNGSGLVTAKEDGTAVIAASFAGFSGSSTVTVTDRVVQSISITPANVSVAAGLTVQLNVLAGMSDSTALTWASSVTWTSSNTGVATVSGSGLVTGVATGTASITAAVGNHSDTTTVTVTPAVPQSVSVTPSASVVSAGTSEQLAASATYSNGLVSALGWGAAWASSNTAVAIVDGRGVVTGIAAGSAAISVSVGGVTGAATVTVGPALLVSISVSPAAATVAAGSTSQLTATGYYSDGSRVAVSGATWTSDNPAVATVSGTGVVTGVGAGTATVTAGFGGTVGASIVTVPAPQQAVLRSIIILTPGGQTTLVDDATMPLQAYGTYSDGTSAALSAGIVWSSSNTNVATVDSNGHVIGVDEGTVAVTVTDKATGISQSVGLTVTENGGANPEGTRHDRKTLLF